MEDGLRKLSKNCVVQFLKTFLFSQTRWIGSYFTQRRRYQASPRRKTGSEEADQFLYGKAQEDGW